MTGQTITKSDFLELMMGILTAKLNARRMWCQDANHRALTLTADEISFIRTVADNIYTFAVADGMGRAFEAMRRDAGLPEEVKP